MSNKVIHKQVIDLDTVATLGDALLFEVPRDAELVDIQWDTRNRLGIAFWYQTSADGVNEGLSNELWNFIVRGTGQPFLHTARHLSTVVRDGYAWHVFDADGNHIRWAPS